jgi:hypothetical protein
MTKLAIKIPFEGFYESTHQAILDDWLEYEQDVLMTEKGKTLEQVQELAESFAENIDWKAVHLAYAKKYVETFNEFVANETRIKLNAEFIELTSPREYNFSTDCIYANVDTNIFKAIPRLSRFNATKWAEFVKAEYTSYDGFFSFYPSNVNEWPVDIAEWGEARLGSLLEFWLSQYVDELQHALSAFSLMEDLRCNGAIAELIFNHANKEFIELLDALNETEGE